jgi:hypothetical protein
MSRVRNPHICDMHIQTCINEERSEYGVSTLWVQSFTYIENIDEYDDTVEM